MIKARISILLKLGMVCAAIFAAVRSGFFSAWKTMLEPGLLLGGLVVQPIVLCALAVLTTRHVLLVGTPRITLAVAFRAMVLSQGLNLVLPIRLSELLKATYLRNHANVPLSSGLSAVVLERTVDVLIVATLGLLALVLYFDQGNFTSLPLVGLVLAISVCVLVRFPGLMMRLIHALPSVHLIGFFERTYLHFASTAGTRTFWQALWLGGVAWCLSYVNILVFLKMGGSIQVGFSGALMVFVMTTLGGAIPALPGGLGTYEAAAVIALRSLGYSFNEALALSLTMHAAQLILPFVLAVLIMMTERLGISSLIADLRGSVRAEDGG